MSVRKGFAKAHASLVLGAVETAPDFSQHHLRARLYSSRCPIKRKGSLLSATTKQVLASAESLGRAADNVHEMFGASG